MALPELKGFNKEELDEVVECLKKALKDPKLREVSQRAVQGKIWHLEPKVASVLSDLKAQEEVVRSHILKVISSLVYQFHEHTLDTTLARAGLKKDVRVHAGSFLEEKNGQLDLICLDAKERLYILLKEYGWLQEFFRLYPLHFYENSFAFVDRIPKKKLRVKVKVVGLGIGGSMAVSGLAKAGVDTVIGYDKRNQASVTSRYQNASWRAYDVAQKLLDEQAYDELMAYRQKINVKYDDGTTGVMISDRVQIILGGAIGSALGSAERYGAKLEFEKDLSQEDTIEDKSDIVALFAGAHTCKLFDDLETDMHIYEWPEVQSDCKMWLKIKPSEKEEAYSARSGEVGAENWHYTIESARATLEDIARVKNNVERQYQGNLKKLKNGTDIGISEEEITKKYTYQMDQLNKVQSSVEGGETPGGRFDYIFTNAPTNEHNLSKREEAIADGTVVLDGGYLVELKLAANSSFEGNKKVTKHLNSEIVVCGGDACVPPNPQAAYGATLACESAEKVVQLAIGYGHLNAILADLEEIGTMNGSGQWKESLVELKSLLKLYYEARGRSENYFQW
eukprot:CAMPEP_0202453544 /NCGR_PEP_ID=MMETSP1360-20130828/11495_1 /ASSEMBLY_ACC=CAM_ASM_000848 /TAXON_ID=515479 /ORGANISM="Licmophora paradoxa, Strain CCMP2313" /LENGTH=564 /DNA_ID=CAMNT_0049072671 /DNA_START=126 /DNA_END=1817 /DNA_ORIENTATION=-